MTRGCNSVDAIRYAAELLTGQEPSPMQLATAYRALQIAEASIQELAFLDPYDPLPGWPSAAMHAARARGALARAPSLRWPPAGPPPTVLVADAEIVVVIDALIELVDTVVLALIECSVEAARSEDEVRCLQAALHSNELREALHVARGGVRRADEP